MNLTSVKTGGFANGFDYFYAGCGVFFSAQIMYMDDRYSAAECCPSCGDDRLFVCPEDLLPYCLDNNIDPVNFYHAFPPDEPIPQSRTGAAPRQVERIIGCVASGRQKKIPVTAESLAAELGYDKKIVAAVLDELHITESGAAA
jgi:hypothetical protein